MNILLVHGPNLNLLCKRQPEIYGTQTLDNINHYLIQVAQKQGVELKTFQSNHEGAIVSEIGDNNDWADGVLINTAIAEAKNPVLMAESMKHAVIAGRKAFKAERMKVRKYASASSPQSNLI